LNVAPDAVVTAEALRERNTGALTGVCKATARSTYGVDMISRWKVDGEVEPLGGETMSQVGRRMHDFVYSHALYECEVNDVVLLISHSNAIKSFFNWLGIDIGLNAGSLSQDHLILFDLRASNPSLKFISCGYQ
jgi:2,3-bisphosphoglycerate-dependent phosphoglycerate mutase